MRILFTGASSFTGYWFVRELHAAGHEVSAIFRRRPDAYPDAIRQTRANQLASRCRPVYDCSFGDEAFVRLAADGRFDLLCHHAADVTNYKSPDFNVTAAVENNTHNLPTILEALSASGCRKVLLTGSVFENGEGAGSEGLPAFSPYGLSKALTAEMLRYYTARAGMSLGKFVIPNPFGPLEEPRFTAYLVKNWFAGKTPSVNTPAYVRDNIHVSLLAKSYVQFAEQMPEAGFVKLNPSGYVESQGAFAIRFAAEMRKRLGLACELELKQQTDFSEPRIRLNTDMIDGQALGWDQSAAWDAIATFYQQQFGK